MRRVNRVLGLVVIALVLAVLSPSGRDMAIAKRPPDARDYYTKEECDAKFLTKEEAADFLTVSVADGRYVNDGQAEVNGDDIAVGTEVVGTNGGGPVFRATNTGQSGHGLIGSGNIGVLGIGHTVNGNYWAGVLGMCEYGPGVQGMSDNGFGGEFWGFSGLRLNVHGSFHCDGAKYAVVPMEDGTRRTVTCMESPEVWFEDFGTGQLVKGTALVGIEPLFLQTINTQCEYHVFLTPEGDCRGLYVCEKRAESFVVRELQSGTSNLRFSYRIVAKRRGYETQRLDEQPEPGL